MNIEQFKNHVRNEIKKENYTNHEAIAFLSKMQGSVSSDETMLNALCEIKDQYIKMMLK